jgi:3-phenylpropionate/trans-cinnamate dioxygenase ferredoxin subunit
MGSFTRVGDATMLKPGKMTSVRTPSGRRLVLNVGGQYHALATDCTHQGCDLADGSLDGGRLTCMCHFAEFDVATGKVLAGPATEPVRCYRVELRPDGVWVEG